MGTDEGERRLAAILSADVAGYSTLMGDDERATVRTLTDYRKVFGDHIARHKGRVVDTAGDSILAVFGSVVEAVQCAVNVQSELATRNSAMPESRRMDFRVGINLGDVIEQDDGTIYGDGVNVAARLEALAAPGGIAVSGTVFDHAENKLSVAFEPAGEHEVKNIAKPVRVYRVRGEAASEAEKSRLRTSRSWRVPGVLATVVFVAGAFIFWFAAPAPEPNAETAGPERIARVAHKSAIAVLPFVNLSKDANQEWFADGLTESLINDLATLENVLVIARSSVYQYKGKAVDVTTVARELDVDYVIEGSIQAAGDRVRINAQIIDGKSGTHIWSDRYDRNREQYFVIQDQIIGDIIKSLDIRVLRGESARLSATATTSLKAYEYSRRAAEFYFNSEMADCNTQQQYLELIEKAHDADPNFSGAYVGFAHYHYEAGLYGCVPQSAEHQFNTAVKYSLKAIEQNPFDAEAYGVLSIAHMSLRQFDKFIEAGDKAVELSPNNATQLNYFAWGLTHTRQYKRAKFLSEKALRLQPFHPAWWQNVRGMTSFWLGNYDEALEAIETAYSRTPEHLYTLVYKTVILAAMGRAEDALSTGEILMQSHKDFTIDQWLTNNDPFQDPEDAQRIRDLLESAGLK